MKKVLYVIASLLSSTTYASTETHEFSPAGLKRLNLKSTNGDILITTSNTGNVYIITNKEKFEKGCSWKAERIGPDLLVEVKKGNWFSDDNCEIQFEIKVPKEITLNLRNGSGKLNITNTKGKVEFQVGSGDVKVNAEVEKLEGRTGSGAIEVFGLQGDADAKTGSGSITLAYPVALSQGEIDVKTGSGDTTLFLPLAMKINSHLKTGNGQILNELGDSPESFFSVSLQTGKGNISIRKVP